MSTTIITGCKNTEKFSTIFAAKLNVSEKNIKNREFKTAVSVLKSFFYKTSGKHTIMKAQENKLLEKQKQNNILATSITTEEFNSIKKKDKEELNRLRIDCILQENINEGSQFADTIGAKIIRLKNYLMDDTIELISFEEKNL